MTQHRKQRQRDSERTEDWKKHTLIITSHSLSLCIFKMAYKSAFVFVIKLCKQEKTLEEKRHSLLTIMNAGVCVCVFPCSKRWVIRNHSIAWLCTHTWHTHPALKSLTRTVNHSTHTHIQLLSRHTSWKYQKNRPQEIWLLVNKVIVILFKQLTSKKWP